MVQPIQLIIARAHDNDFGNYIFLDYLQSFGGRYVAKGGPGLTNLIKT